MRVVGLAIKPNHGSKMITRKAFQLVRGLGIRGDTNARRNSARQVLIAGCCLYEELGLPTGALRENILVDSEVTEWRSGQLLRIGTATLRVTFACEVCKKLNVVRPGLARCAVGRRGVLARVVVSGQVGCGDRVEVLRTRLPAIPNEPRERIYDLLLKTPRGRVTSSVAAISVLGLLRGYARVLPRVLKGAPEHIPVHRMVTANQSLIERHVPYQRGILRAEGVQFDGGRVNQRFLWNAIEYFGPELVDV